MGKCGLNLLLQCPEIFRHDCVGFKVVEQIKGNLTHLLKVVLEDAVDNVPPLLGEKYDFFNVFEFKNGLNLVIVSVGEEQHDCVVTQVLLRGNFFEDIERQVGQSEVIET